MKKLLAVITLVCFTLFSFGQKKDEQAILKLMSEQELAWNRGDLTGFMQGYWKSDSLMFIGSKGLTYGWQPTLDNYKKGYPDTARMGKLHFTILKVKRLSGQYYYVVGKWFLKRSVGDVGGHFDLLFRKEKEGWRIIADHSS